MVLLNNEEIIEKLRVLKARMEVRDKDPRTRLKKVMDEFLKARWEEHDKQLNVLTGMAGRKAIDAAFEQELKRRLNGKSIK